MAIFQLGDFTLASGLSSGWKIECDSLTSEDWQALALMASDILPPFGRVDGVPRGGIPFADALLQYADSQSDVFLIAEDVVTTGGSMERYRNGRDAIGICAFSRGQHPDWVKAIFVLSQS